MSGAPPSAAGAWIRTRLASLTPRERAAVRHILSMPDLSEETSLEAVAEGAGVSQALVVKIAKKLDYAGFRDLRRGLAAYRRSETAALHAEIEPADGPAEIVAKVCRTTVQAIEETRAILDMGAFEAAARAVAGARRLDLYGLGGSAQIARDAAHKFLRIGRRAAVHDDAHMMLMSASVMSAEDVVLAISHSGATRAVLEPARLARARGATVLALTNFATSPLTEIAHVSLCSTAQGSALLGENAAARVAQLVLLDALFAAVAQGDGPAALDALDRTTRAVRGKRGDAAP